MPLLIPLAIAVAIALGYWAWKYEQAKRAKFAAWAQARGFSYDHRTDKELRHAYGFLDRLQIGHSRRGYHVLRGRWEGRPAAAFQFQYTVGSGKNQHTVRFGVALLHLEQVFPELLIAPENFLHRFAEMFGLGDIDFESVEFSQAFRVSCRDKKFAYDFCHTGMMEYLLAHRDVCLEMEAGVMALFDEKGLEPERLDAAFQRLHAIRAKMPEYLFRA